MKKFLLLILTLFSTCTNVFALEVVYPKTNPVKIDAEASFFIGSVNKGEKLKINDINVKVSETGAFAQSVVLDYGQNIFVLTSTDTGNQIKTLTFTIERPQLQETKIAPVKVIDYPISGIFYVKKDNTPLRSTPVDGGINRLSHLSKDTFVLVNGEQKGFYRVYLSPTQTGWIDKSALEQKIEPNFATLKKAYCKNKDGEDFLTYKFELDKKIPFYLSEKDGLSVELFNIQNQKDNKIIIEAPVEKLMGYDAYFEGSDFVLKIRKHPKINCKKPLKDITLTLDAGHGGKESGAVGCCGALEKNINLAITKKLEQELENRGANVLLTRNSDIDVSLSDRVKFAKENNSSLLISIHANAVPDGVDPNKNSGTSIYYYHPQAKPLADSILCSMTTQLGINNDKVRQGSLALVRPTSSVSILIEVGYMINPTDYEMLINEDFQTKCAKAIADGIENYLLNNTLNTSK